MPARPRMVRALKGSTTLRTASQAFSLAFIGFTCGPSRKRTYQLISGFGGHGAGFRLRSSNGLAGFVAMVAAAPAPNTAAPSLLIWQGSITGALAWVGIWG